MHLIVYTSELTERPENIDKILTDIVTVSKINNQRRAITGLLFYHNERFLQFIEGEKHELESLMLTLAKDPRHKNIERIIDEYIPVRGFTNWSMESLNLSNNEVISLSQLNSIRDVYKKNFNIVSNILSMFYKLMLESYNLNPKTE